MIFSMKEFIQFRDFIYQKTGLFFEEKKIFFIKKRIEKRVDALDCTNPTDYLRLLKFGDPNGLEFQNFINLVTVNETYFFREFDQLACFAEDCLPEVQEQKPPYGHRNLNVWCAACSTGEEAYTLAIILEAMTEENSGWKYRILATDIDQNVLRFAKRGVYEERSVKDMPPEYFKTYIKTTPQGYSVTSSLKEFTFFEHLNFMNRDTMRAMRDFDFVFCRNALIYFDETSRKEVVDHLYNALNPGGFIYLGHSESIGRITTKFKLRRFGKNLVYQKPLL